MKNKDRKLIETVAELAGICGHLVDNGFCCRVEHNLVKQDYVWNPLEDDGDAFRLQVKFDIDVVKSNDTDSEYNENTYCTVEASNQEGFQAVEHELQDPRAAARRAIVRAVAALATKEV